MEHLLPSEIASAVFLLLLGATRHRYFVLACAQPVASSGSTVSRARQLPAYVASTVWSIYVAWLILAPEQLVHWDRWTASHWLNDLLGWIAIPILGAAIWLFWFSHDTIGRYWSIRVELKTEHRLVTEGPYRYIRHPLYTALFVGYLGTMLALQSWALVAWFPAFVLSYVVFANEEERVMEGGFQEAYRAYCRQTGLFLPYWPRLRADVLRSAARWRAGVSDRCK